MIEFSEFIYDAFAKKHCANVLIDLKKAFDTVNHLILLKKLELYGIRGIPLNWFRSFLGNRDCFISITNINSERKLINIGVPQGSILGPILFLVYINDLPNISNLFHATLYADDTTISVSDQNATSLINNTNFVLEKIDNWSIANRLTINTSKTELILTTNRLDDCTGRPDVILRGACVDSSSHCKFLGVIVDAKLSFKQHIGHVVIKTARTGGILYRIRDSLNARARLNFYNSFILPYFTYNVLIWGSTTKNHLNPLILQQKRIVRTMTSASFIEHTGPIFKKLKLLKLIDIHKFEVLKYMFKYRNDASYAVGHARDTRNRNLLVPKPRKLTKTQKSISFVGPQEWNKLPDFLKESKNINVFKKFLKNHLLSFY